MRRLLWISCAVVITLGAACEKTETPTTPTPPSNNVVYTVVGASDGIGYGGSVACFLFEDCPNGTGYPWLIKRRLQSEGRTVTLNNRAVPGAVLSPAVLALARELGRGITDVPGSFIEQIAPFVPSNTTHVTIFAGGNDAN